MPEQIRRMATLLPKSLGKSAGGRLFQAGLVIRRQDRVDRSERNSSGSAGASEVTARFGKNCLMRVSGMTMPRSECFENRLDR